MSVLSKIVSRDVGERVVRALDRQVPLVARTGSVLGHDVAHFAPQAEAAFRQLPRLAEVKPGVFRGGAATSEAQFRSLVKDGGFTRIASLLDRTNPKETAMIALEERMAKELGVELHFLEMPFGKRPPQHTVDELLRLSREADAHPLYVHCREGKDRTGTAVALIRMHEQGVPVEKALAEMRRFGHDPVAEPYLAYLDDFLREDAKTLPAKGLMASLQAGWKALVGP